MKVRQKFNSICPALAEFEISFGNEYSSTYIEDPCRYLSQHLSICYVQADFKSISLLSGFGVCVFGGDREEFRNCCILFCIICIIRQNAANRTVLSPLLALISLYLCLYTIPLRKFKTRNSIESLSCPEASGQWTADSGSLKRGNEKIFVHFL